MEITNLKTTHIHVPLPEPFSPAWMPGGKQEVISSTILEIKTDEGITGIAGSSHHPGLISGGKSESEIAVENFLESSFIGEDPTKVEKLIHYVRKAGNAISNPWFVTTALWDIIGKKAGLPLYKLWGGFRDRIPAYASLGEVKAPKKCAEDVKDLRKEGFEAVKIRLHCDTIEEDISQIKAVREEVGDEFEIMVDANQSFSLGERGPKWDFKRALKTARELEEFDVAWLEEPLLGDDFDTLSRLRDKTTIDIAGGEFNKGISTFRRMLENGVYDVLQPDCNMSEGIFQLRKIAGIAESYNKWFEPHTWGNGLLLAASLHVAASAPNCRYLEYPYDPPTFPLESYYGMLKNKIEINDDGMVKLPEKPGIGVELDKDALRKYSVE